ncbi:MAG: glycosyltransferase family 4 protein [Chloroflexi bacterium]|nr:glycosyltransferase family 4 protein [Chloroflexota bacterium]
MTTPRRLLVIAYFFPPLGGVGVQRTLKFVRHLGASGWRSVVVTPGRPAYPIRDPGLLDEIPGDTEVVRTTCPEPAGLAGSLAGRFAPADRTDGTPPRSPLRRGRRGRSRAALRTAGRWWTRLVRILLFPDDQALWWPFAVRAGLRAHRAQPVDAIYSSSPPVTGHLIGRSLKGLTGRPWIADFRDPWVGNAFAGPISWPRRRLQAWLERQIVERADRVIVVSPSIQRALQIRYPGQAAKILCIPNGYDRADLNGIEPTPREPGRFAIVYAGSIYGDRELTLFLDGLELLLTRRPELRTRLRVEFVGRVNVANQQIAARYAGTDRLGGIVSWTGFLPRREAVARMRSADALLQLIADDPGKDAVVGAKTVEYLAFDLPILAVVPRGDARAVLEELDWGVVADPEPEAIATGLERIVETPRPARRADPEGRYDRAAQARRLAEVLAAAVAEAVGGHSAQANR